MSFLFYLDLLAYRTKRAKESFLLRALTNWVLLTRKQEKNGCGLEREEQHERDSAFEQGFGRNEKSTPGHTLTPGHTPKEIRNRASGRIGDSLEESIQQGDTTLNVSRHVFFSAPKRRENYKP